MCTSCAEIRGQDNFKFSRGTRKSRKHSIYTHFLKDRNCDVCLRTKITRASCRSRTGEAPLRAEKFGDGQRRITKSSMREVNPETITGTLSCCKILPLSGFNLLRAKQNLHTRRKKAYETETCVFRQLEGIWGQHVQFYDGTTALQHLIDLRQMVSRPTSKGRYFSSITAVRTR